MSSITPHRDCLLLHECGTDFIAVLSLENCAPDKIGVWLMKELSMAGDYALDRRIKPHVRVIPTQLSQEEIDKFETEELLCHCYYQTGEHGADETGTS